MQPVREVIKARATEIERVLVDRDGGPTAAGVARFAAGRGVAVSEVGRGELDRLAEGGRHQGVIAIAAPLSLVAIEDLVLGDDALVAVLDGIMDPQNFGAVIRSAVAFGATAIVWPEHASAPLTPATFRASAGAIEHATLARVASLPAAIDALASRGVRAVALDANGDVAIGALDLRGPIAIVIGAEDKGVRKPVRRACAHVARLPMKGTIDSLNASVAGAIAFYEVRRQRSAT